MTTKSASAKRLSKADRRKQLLSMARALIKEEGADALTLGNLAVRAGVSKPVVYDHFISRNGLLVQLYKLIDAELTADMQRALTLEERSFHQRARELASAYMQCASDTSGEWHVVAAALAGSTEETMLNKELLAGAVEMFINVLSPYTKMNDGNLRLKCIGLVGSADALSVAMLQKKCQEADAVDTLENFIINCLWEYLR